MLQLLARSANTMGYATHAFDLHLLPPEHYWEPQLNLVRIVSVVNNQTATSAEFIGLHDVAEAKMMILRLLHLQKAVLTYDLKQLRNTWTASRELGCSWGHRCRNSWRIPEQICARTIFSAHALYSDVVLFSFEWTLTRISTSFSKRSLFKSIYFAECKTFYHWYRPCLNLTTFYLVW